MNCKSVKHLIESRDDLPDKLERTPPDIREHLFECEPCRRLFFKQVELQKLLRSYRDLKVPDHVLADFLPGIYRKLENLANAPATEHAPTRRLTQIFRPGWARPAFALLAILLLVLGLWRFDILTPSRSADSLYTSDSLDYYLESFDEVSSTNPVAVVKGMEYEWAFYDESNGE